jgi:hypothetical protein
MIGGTDKLAFAVPFRLNESSILSEKLLLLAIFYLFAFYC